MSAPHSKVLSASLREVMRTGASMFVVLVGSLGAFALVAAVTERFMPDLALILVAATMLVGAVRGAKALRILPVAVGVSIVVAGLSVLAVVEVQRLLVGIPELRAATDPVLGVLTSTVAAFLLAAASAWGGRVVARKFQRSPGGAD